MYSLFYRNKIINCAHTVITSLVLSFSHRMWLIHQLSRTLIHNIIWSMFVSLLPNGCLAWILSETFDIHIADEQLACALHEQLREFIDTSKVPSLKPEGLIHATTDLLVVARWSFIEARICSFHHSRLKSLRGASATADVTLNMHAQLNEHNMRLSKKRQTKMFHVYVAQRNSAGRRIVFNAAAAAAAAIGNRPNSEALCMTCSVRQTSAWFQLSAVKLPNNRSDMRPAINECK